MDGRRKHHRRDDRAWRFRASLGALAPDLPGRLLRDDDRAQKELYAITVGENPDYLIPALGFRGTPTGIDIFKVVEKKVLPVLDVGIAGRNGGQIGAASCGRRLHVSRKPPRLITALWLMIFRP